MRELLIGENVRLTAIKECDLPTIADWFNDIKFLRYYDMLPAIPKSRRQIEDFIKDFEASSEKYIFAVRIHESGKIIGIAGFDEIIWSNGAATVFIGIGDSCYTGKGLGTEAMRLLLDFGFNELNFYRIHLNVLAYNEPAIMLYEKLGFVKEGTYREFIYRDGKRYDMYLYGMLKSEWEC